MTLSNETDEQVMIRPGVVEDVPFIFNSWLKSYREAPAVQGVPNAIYYKEHHDVIERILAAPGLQVLVVCNKEHTEQIYSYLVASLDEKELTVHWVYTKHPFRRLGMAEQLYNALMTIAPLKSTKTSLMYSQRTGIGGQLAYKRQLIYNPYKAR